MKIIVFGGSGFLGSHVADALAKSGHDVIIYDLKPSPFLMPAHKMIVGDIIDEKKVRSAIKGCEVVYNFAGIADIDQASKRPLDTIKHNVLGNAIILEACRGIRLKRYIYASSLYVYSSKGAFYRSAKQSCELIIENYHEVFGLPYTIIRYGSLYGHRADEKNFVFNSIKQALLNGKIVREGDGEEVREYINVLDAARNSVDILSKEFENQYIIITGNQQMKVKDLLGMIKEILGNKIKIKYVTPKYDSHYEISPYAFSPKLAKRLVNRSHIDLGQGVLDLIRSLHDQINHRTVVDGLIIKQPLPARKR